ncbi:MAG TPA: hypothetical protein VGM09_02125, partial [Bradyrhizobium sp.]
MASVIGEFTDPVAWPRGDAAAGTVTVPGTFRERTICPKFAGRKLSGTDEQHLCDGVVEPRWIITNPPFGLAIEFALRALELVTEGVALLVRVQWLESAGRYEKLFRDAPPAIFAPFAERVPM